MCISGIDRKTVCNEPKRAGPCKAAVPRWYYNSNTGKCDKFTWGVCSPNANNFKDMVECTKACAGTCCFAIIF